MEQELNVKAITTCSLSVQQNQPHMQQLLLSNQVNKYAMVGGFL